jgi:short subunit dehydrogenase-like uncharacterized protein
MERELDIVLFGATGFTGRLVAEHLLKVYGAGKDLKWAIAGRDKSKLEIVRNEIGAPATLSLVVADTTDPASLTNMVRRTKLVASTVGPYRVYGTGLVAACASEGTDYVDITGESTWMHDMLVHQERAKASGARIVFACGFDSIPFELGVYFLQKAAKAKFGAFAPRVRGRIRKLYPGIRGGMSGGSLATIMSLIQLMQKDPQLISVLNDPFALTPGSKAPEQPDGNTPYEDKTVGSWVGPFMMAPINTKIVHRSNFLMGHPWGKGFKYDEMTMIDGPPDPNAAPWNPFTDPNMKKPGEGPSKADREGAFYQIVFIGEATDGQILRASVRSVFDASADSTSRLMAESAMCLVRDISREKTPGGMWTCSSAMGDSLIKRLEANAGITFEVEQ